MSNETFIAQLKLIAVVNPDGFQQDRLTGLDEIRQGYGGIATPESAWEHGVANQPTDNTRIIVTVFRLKLSNVDIACDSYASGIQLRITHRYHMRRRLDVHEEPRCYIEASCLANATDSCLPVRGALTACSLVWCIK